MDELPLVGSDPCRDRPLCAFGVICRLGRRQWWSHRPGQGV